jgi:hypothetical protein
MYFEIVGPITSIERVAVGTSIRQLSRLRRRHGRGPWRKLKGVAMVRLAGGELRRAEIHWYEAQGSSAPFRRRDRGQLGHAPPAEQPA